MIIINDEFVLNNKRMWREAVKVQPLIIEKLHLNKFNGRSKLIIQTINGPFNIDKDTYEKELKENLDNGYVIIYSVNIQGKKVSKTYIKQNITGNKILDRWVVRISDLKKLGYIKYKYGTYRKEDSQNVRVFPLTESAKLRTGINGEFNTGKPGDIIAVFGKGEYKIIDREIFDGNYEFINKR